MSSNSFWVHNITGNLKFISYSMKQSNFQGKWDWVESDDNHGFTLELFVKGNKIEGYHNAFFQGGNRIDGGSSGDNTLNGTVSGNVAEVTFISTYCGECSKGTAKITLNGNKLEWKIIKAPEGGEYWIPQLAIMYQKNGLNNKTKISEPKNIEDYFIILPDSFFFKLSSQQRKEMVKKNGNQSEKKHDQKALWKIVKKDIKNGYISFSFEDNENPHGAFHQFVMYLKNNKPFFALTNRNCSYPECDEEKLYFLEFNSGKWEIMHFPSVESITKENFLPADYKHKYPSSLAIEVPSLVHVRYLLPQIGVTIKVFAEVDIYDVYPQDEYAGEFYKNIEYIKKSLVCDTIEMTWSRDKFIESKKIKKKQ